jgi:PAS domain S-box-containing protein
LSKILKKIKAARYERLKRRFPEMSSQHKRDGVEAAELRSRAEELLLAKMAKSHLPLSEADTQRLIHELEVHRIELEMQNAELRRARDDAKTALDKYTELYDFAPVGYFTLDRNGVIRGVNLTGADLLGIVRSQLIGRRFTLVLAEEARSTFAAFLEKVFAGRGKDTCEVTLPGKKEEPLFVRIEGAAGKSGEECRVAVIDISEQKRAEEERMITQQSRQAAIAEMISNIAHHWRQPLNAVGLIIQEAAFASENGGLSAEHLKKRVDDAMRIIQSMSQTLNNFRNLFTPDKGKSRFKVNQVVAETVSFVEENFKEKQIAIDVKSLDDLFIDGYPNEYSQVLLSILFNARDALSEKAGGSGRVTISSFAEKGKSVVTIGDNGGGIKKEIMDRIFEPYFTTKLNRNGTGVGLFMAKNVIENHMGGRLTARNVKGGAEFRIEV